MQVFSQSLGDCSASKPQSKRQQRRCWPRFLAYSDSDNLSFLSYLFLVNFLLSLKHALRNFGKNREELQNVLAPKMFYTAPRGLPKCSSNRARLGVYTDVSCALAERGLVANDPSSYFKHAANQVPVHPLGSLNMEDSLEILAKTHLKASTCFRKGSVFPAFKNSRNPGLHMQYAMLIFQPLQV